MLPDCSARPAKLKLQLPCASAVVLPTCWPLRNTLTVSPTGAVPRRVCDGGATGGMPLPGLLAACNPVMAGVAGVERSMVALKPCEVGLVPAATTSLALNE